VKHVAITLERLPAIFNDFTIAHLSDFHYHPFFTAKPIARAVLLVNQLEPDLIVLTGDFVSPSFVVKRTIVLAHQSTS